MIRVHDALIRQAREFFAAYLATAYPWSAVRVMPIEENPEIEGRRMTFANNKVPADSRYREMVRLLFNPWELVLVSSNEHPPLGEISLRGDTMQVIVSGPIAPETWDKVAGEILKTSKPARKYANVYR